MFKHKKVLIYIISMISLIFFLSGCTKNKPEPISKEGLFLGTYCKITVFDNVSTDVLDKAFNRVNEIENKMTINKPTSEIISVNSKSGLDYVKVSPDTFYVVKTAKHYSELAQGKFDVTIGPIVKLWNIGTDKARVPSPKEIQDKLPLVSYKNMVLNEKENKIMLKQKGMLIDLGAIAKGYAGDEVKKVLEANGVKHALINLGGNIVAVGSKVDNKNWKLGVQDPFNPRGEYLGTIEVSNKSIVTSGVYERYLEKNGKKYHHILSPENGYPIENSIVSVTIVTDQSIDADALSTTVFALGLNDGLKLIDSMKNAEAILVTKDKNIYTTSGIKDNLKITNSQFKFKNSSSK
ncbi:FAD:protein FMN transferase [Clostridium sp. MB40-C1]|uniref:FAD:protein FMN transferase n=1 Tax=Clostridium sp. MB40-C1 TaxID=3070996 RepID=UPI0027DEBA46|nr:FAD:protein FMN transferase [Clostridium sp. MB40-C1]WMJ79938.1 FAD:protein FMN transferase [Clostridium sp. MB40-C1]